MPPEVHFDITTVDFSRSLVDRGGIRAVNPHRFEMEMIDAIVLIDSHQHLIVGYKDVREDEFWVRGHFPAMPLLPGVLMCEAAAQLCSYYAMTHGVIDSGSIMGFGGMEDVRFRGPVRPGDRLVLAGKGQRLRRKHSVFSVQGFVNGQMVFHGDVIGVPLVGSPGE